MRALIALLLFAGLGAAFCVACGPQGTDGSFVPPAAALAENDRGVGLMGRFDFAGAVPVFQAVVDAHPRWLDARVNLAIARLNRSNAEAKDLQAAEALLEAVLREDPDHVRARYCRGILHVNAGESAAARPIFERLAREDPEDAYSAYFAAQASFDQDDLEDALRLFKEARARDPALRSAWYGGFQVLRALGRDDEAAPWLTGFRTLKDEIQAFLAEIKYSRMGPKANALAVDPTAAEPAARPTGPVFEPATPLVLTGAEGALWSTDEAAARVSITACDIDGDGRVDLFAAGALDAGKRSAVLFRDSSDKFAFRLDREHPLAQVADVRVVLWGDYDGDGLTDVYLATGSTNRLYRQTAKGEWADVTGDAKAAGGTHATRDGAFVDFDHDGDLDLLLVHEDAPLEILVNRYDGTFMPLPKDAVLPLDERLATGLVLADLDRDRDLDLIVLHGEGQNEVLLNDRLWTWRKADAAYDALRRWPADSGVVTDWNADGQVELVLANYQGVTRCERDAEGRWITTSDLLTPGLPGKLDSGPVRLAVLDADGDGHVDVCVTQGVSWQVIRARDGAKLASSTAADRERDPVPVLDSAATGMALVGFTPGQGFAAWRPGSGRFGFAAVSFSGRHKLSDQMRSNASGIGVRAAFRMRQSWTVRWNYRPASGPGQSLQPLAVGLGGAQRIDFVDLLWSDGLVQSETLLEGGEHHRIEETQRQTSSCPVLFAWDGTRHAFVTDLLGVGGMGFWVAPGTYAPSHPRESLLLPDGLLKARDGAFVLKLGEPMEEGCYLDSAALDVIDVPPGWHVTVDDRMVVEGPVATGKRVFYRRAVSPTRVTDQARVDVTAATRVADRVAAPTAPRDERFLGRTAEQVLTLEFAQPLDSGAGDPVLLADGWIEYPYAQTLFAAWQADARYEAPTLEARGADGRWTVLLRRFGYPAGMPRTMSVPLRGLPKGTTALRMRTTLEIYWDRLAVAYAEPCPQARTTSLPLQRSTLSYVGFAKRTDGPQRIPHYDYRTRAPLWDARHQAGFYTAFGDVGPLLAREDDAVAIFGPGEEVELRFAAPTAPPPQGWRRRFVVRTAGWCKDMDLFTKDGETLAPLPRREPGTASSAHRDALHKRFNTRYRSGR